MEIVQFQYRCPADYAVSSRKSYEARADSVQRFCGAGAMTCSFCTTTRNTEWHSEKVVMRRKMSNVQEMNDK